MTTATISRPDRVWQADKPIRPSWDGEARYEGCRFVAGRDHVEAAAFELLNRTDRVWGCDIETVGKDRKARFSVKVVTVGTEHLVVALDPRDPPQREILKMMLREAEQLVFHNAAFDIPVLVQNGLADIEACDRVWDTFIAAKLALPGKEAKGLADLGVRYLGLEDTSRSIAEQRLAAGFRTNQEWYALGDIDLDLYLKGAMADTAALLPLARILEEEAVATMVHRHGYKPYGASQEDAEWVLEREQIVNRVMLWAACRGLKLNDSYVDEYKDRQLAAQAKAKALLIESGFENTGRGKGAKLLEILDARGELPPRWERTPKTGALKADRKKIEQRLKGNPLADAYLLDTAVDKMLVDYLDKPYLLEIGGRVYPTVNILHASTGRMSVSGLPYQQFPEDARPLIVADDPGGWMSIDWTAVEPLTAAYLAGEDDFARELVGGADTYVPIGRSAGLIPLGLDDESAHEHKGRKIAKVILLGLMYGKGVASLAADLGVSYDEAQALKANVLAGIPNIGALLDSLRYSAGRVGHCLTAAGRLAVVSTDDRGKPLGYQAQNFMIQGSAYDCLADALAEIHARGLASKVRLAVHDELVVTADAAEEVEHIMRHSTGSLQRWTGRTDLVLPTDSHPLPETWLAV